MVFDVNGDCDSASFSDEFGEVVVNDLLKDLKIDCEKVIQNLVNTGCDEAWSIIKLNNMIQDVDDALVESCMNCHGDKFILDIHENKWPCNECMDEPTISDYLEANKDMIEKTKCKVVTIESLRKFGGKL